MTDEVDQPEKSCCPKCRSPIRPLLKLRRIPTRKIVCFDLYFRCGCSEVMASRAWETASEKAPGMPEAWRFEV